MTFFERMELLIGPAHPRPDWSGSHFLDDEHRRRCWEEHRDELLERDRLPARRPWAWWAYEPGIPDELRDREAWGYRQTDVDRELAAGADQADAWLRAGESLESARVTWLRSKGLLSDEELTEMADEERRRMRGHADVATAIAAYRQKKS